MIGGRCRSFFEKKLGRKIDNGNHLVFSANTNFYELCKIVGSTDRLKVLPPNLFFYDLKKNLSWNLNLKKLTVKGIFKNKLELIPGSNLLDYLSILKFLYVNKRKTVFDIVGKSRIFESFWDPLTLAVMNTSSKLASANILSNVLKKTILRGEKYCHIYQPKVNWNNAIIEPCINFLNNKGYEIKLRTILKELEISNNLITKLKFNDLTINVNKNDLVVLAIPPSNFLKFFPEYILPKNYNSIINIHYSLPKKLEKKLSHQIVGFINSYTHWVFIKDGYLSVTISDANHLNNLDSNEIANIIWREICSFMNINQKITDFQVVKEKKATIEQSPSNFQLIKKIKNLPRNLRLSGDWTQTNLPCTIEGSILSGKKTITS